jgi:hypothetical protein
MADDARPEPVEARFEQLQLKLGLRGGPARRAARHREPAGLRSVRDGPATGVQGSDDSRRRCDAARAQDREARVAKERQHAADLAPAVDDGVRPIGGLTVLA